MAQPFSPDRQEARPGNYDGSLVLFGITFVLAAIWFLPVAFSHPAGADQILVSAPGVGWFDHIGAGRVYGEIVSWYRREFPGWFPLAPVPLALWLLDAPVRIVKFVQYALIVSTFVTFGFIARRLLGGTPAAVFAIVAALCAWQFRTPHDPVSGTSLIAPWAAELILLSVGYWLAYHDSRKRLWLAFAYAVFVLAMLTGTIALGIGGVLVTIALSSLPRHPASWGLLALYVGSVAAVCILGPPNLPWHHAGSYASNIFAQFLAGLPTSYRAFGHLSIGHIPGLFHGVHYVDDRFINVPNITLRGWVAVMLATIAAFIALRARPRALPRDASRDALLVGTALLLVPSLALGSPGWWRSGLPFGQSFDGVYLEYFGFALLATLAVFRLRRTATAGAKLVPALGALAVFVLCYGNEGANGVGLARSARLDEPRSLIQRAAAAGFFRELPSGTTVAVAPTLPFAKGLAGDVTDAKYALFHYAHRRYKIVPEASLGTRANADVWILGTSLRGQMLVTLSHWAGRDRHGHLLADRAHGYTVFPDVAAYFQKPRRGMDEKTAALGDGESIDVSRICGPVATDAVFDAQAPRVVWGSGFYDAGPVGYQSNPKVTTWVPWGAGPRSYPKMYMASRGVIVIHPSRCPSGSYLIFSAVAVSSAPAMLTILSPHRVDHLAISTVLTAPVVLEFRSRPGHPIKVTFETGAPAADLDPIIYRYEHDRPRDIHIMIEPDEISENALPYSERH